eukprot:gnl/MRDRNA2_/MRDRNA2_29452_c0_seq1.p1 gnl/MRDRNA2_/MRDRNA2_29452_c0~~gnl/MRDRNA2_/MRDRNA2_29452_c0_seq1.p1  ORF type:complete len:1208 (+),score=212.01 gnl/MRDRNA2_/MRDRNA2_29452_c0_seq1:470-3625(+)
MEDVKEAAQGHWREMRRLEAVTVAASLAEGCNLNLPENLTVQVLDAIISTQMEYAKVLLYTFDGRYKVEIRDLEKSLPASAVVRWLDAKQVRPLFHEEADPQRAAEVVVQRHIKEESRLQLVWNANARVEDSCLDLPHATLVHWLSAPQASKYNGCAIVKRYHGDGTYQIQLRDDNGSFTGEIHHVLAVELRPVLYTSNDPNSEGASIVLRHHDEELRLQSVMAINKLTSACYLGLPPSTLVEWSGGARDVNCSKSSVNAKVHGYNMDGTCRIQKRCKNGEFDNEVLCVKAEELRPVFFQAEDPQRAADGVAKEHSAEQLRLQTVQSINKLMQDCRLGLPPGTFVELTGDSSMTAPAIYNGCAVVRVYNRDATYNVQLRTRSGVCNGKTFCVNADELRPVFYHDADPEGAANRVAEAHKVEELNWQRLQGIHGRTKHCCLNLLPNQLVECFANSSQAYRQAYGLKAAGRGRVKRYNCDGTYQINLRDAQGEFSQETACVDAYVLQPVFYAEDEPELVAESVAQRHYAEEQRMQSIRHLHKQLECCHLNLPTDSRIVISAKTDVRTCCFDFGSIWTINTGMFEAIDDNYDLGPYYQVKGFCRHCGSSWLDWVPAERISPVLWEDSSITEDILRRHSSGLVKIANKLGRVILDDAYTKCDHVETEMKHKSRTLSQTWLKKAIKSSMFENQHTMILGEARVSNIKTDVRSTCHEAVIQDLACEGSGCQCLVLVNTSDDAVLTQQALQTVVQRLRIPDLSIQRLDARQPKREEICAQGPYVLVGTPAQALDAIGDVTNDWEMVNAIGSLKWLVVDSVNASSQQLDAFNCCTRAFISRSQRMLKTCTNTAMLNQAFQELSIKAERIVLWPPRKNLSLARVRQYHCAVEREEWKIDTILDILEFVPATHVVILCRSRRVADFVTTEITRRELPAVALHDGLSLEERTLAVTRMRHLRHGALVCADMWGRGFDGGAAWQWGSPVVIGYDVPGVSVIDLETYQNRAGVPDQVPTAQLRQSCFINFVTNADVENMRRVEQHFRITIEEMPMDVFEQLGLV